MISVLIPGGRSETVGSKYPIKIKVKLSSAERVRKSMVVTGEEGKGEEEEEKRRVPSEKVPRLRFYGMLTLNDLIPAQSERPRLFVRTNVILAAR